MRMDDPEAPASEPPVRLIHFSDLHLWRFGLDGDFFPKRAAGLLNLALRRARAFPAAAAEAIVARLAEEEAEFVLFSGDVSTTALSSEFRAARALFAPLRERWGARLIAIPGNHDRYTPRATRNRLFEKLFLEADAKYPIVRNLGRTWSIVGFDVSVPRLFSSAGEASPKLVSDLRRTLAAISVPGRRLLATGHYPILYPPRIRISSDHALPREERDALKQTLDDAGVEIYLHGHKHRRWGLQAGKTLHLNAGSAGMVGKERDKLPGYLRIELPAKGAPVVEEVFLERNEGGKLEWREEDLAIQGAAKL